MQKFDQDRRITYYFDISLLHIIYPILIGRKGTEQRERSEREREGEGLKNYVTLRCSLKRKNVAPSAGDGRGDKTSWPAR